MNPLALLDLFPREHVESLKKHLRECPECMEGISKIADIAFREFPVLRMVMSKEELTQVINSQLKSE